MEWLHQMNAALIYLEEHLEDTIDYERMAQLAGCSPYHFQRIFSYLAGIPLSEYIRRRRMTKAAFDLQRGDKVLDVALRYGYESPTAFNRAFQSIHDMAPSIARKEGAALRAYPPISFKISIRGDVEMNYRMEKKERFHVLGFGIPMGKSIEENFQEVPKFWEQVSTDGSLQKLFPYCNQSEEPKGVLGISACTDKDQWEYYIAVASEQPAPEGMQQWEIPACNWAIFSGQGKMPEACQELQKRIITEWLPTSGYQYANAPDIEVYLNANPANATFEIWLPVEEA